MSSILKFLDTSPTAEEIDGQIQSLRNDIESLRDNIRTLQQYRNARLIIVSRLPPEVLSIIFEYMALPNKPTPTMLDSRRPYKGSLTASQVCKLWRNVALRTPRIWGYIYDQTSVKFTELLLERAKLAPLYLLSCGRWPNDATIKRILQYPGRLKEIHIGHCNAECFNSIAQMKTSSLESLSLASSQYRSCKARFEPTVESGTEPPLRHLSLEDCIFDLDVPFFAHLRTLKLRYEMSRNDNKISVTKILTVLGSMEYLERLELVNVVIGPEKKVSEDFRVHHSRLTSIKVVAAETQGLLLFPHLSCPNIQSAIIQGTEEEVEPDILAPIASSFFGMMPASSHLWKVRAYSAPSSSKCRATIHIWLDSSKDTDAPFQISVRGPPNFQTDLALFSLLPATAPYSFVFEHSCYSASDERLDLDGLYGFLQSLENVQELHCSSLAGVVTILSDTSLKLPGKQSSTTPASPFSLPSLERIVLTQVGRITYRQRKLKKLEQMLDARRAVGAGIKTFQIPHFLTTDEVTRLKPLVGKFVMPCSKEVK